MISPLNLKMIRFPPLFSEDNTLSSDIIVSPVLSPGISIDAYVRAVSAIPVISAEREKELAHQFVSEENLDSARQLVLANLRFVVYVAQGFEPHIADGCHVNPYCFQVVDKSVQRMAGGR